MYILFKHLFDPCNVFVVPKSCLAFFPLVKDRAIRMCHRYSCWMAGKGAKLLDHDRMTYNWVITCVLPSGF